MNGKITFAFFLVGCYVALIALSILHPPAQGPALTLAQSAEAALGPLVGAVVHALYKAESPTQSQPSVVQIPTVFTQAATPSASGAPK